MKRILPTLAIAFVFTLASCSSRSYPTNPYPGNPYPGSPYPNPNGGNGRDVVVTRDGTVVDRNGRVVGNVNNMPPGQAKKLYGSKSARAYAPGQRKKAERWYNDDDRKRGKGRGKGKDRS